MSELTDFMQDEVIGVIESLKDISDSDMGELLKSAKDLNDQLGLNISSNAFDDFMSQLVNLPADEVQGLLKHSKELGEVVGILSTAKDFMKWSSVLQDTTMSDIDKLNFLADEGYDKVADMIIAATPGLNVIVQIPLIGGGVEYALKEGGKITGDYIGPKMDNLAEWIMNKTGGTDWVLANKDRIRGWLGIGNMEEPISTPVIIAPDTGITPIRKERVPIENNLSPVCEEIKSKSASFRDLMRQARGGAWV